MKRRITIAAVLVVAVIVGAALLTLPRNDVVAIYGDGTIQLNSKPISLAEIGKHSFPRPVVIRTFADTAPELMHSVIDALAKAGAEADFEGGKYNGQRPDFIQ